MEISTILTDIDRGLIALPAFQRSYVWKPKQVKQLFESLYRRYPVGCLLIWKASQKIPHRGEGAVDERGVDMLLDGQQRITSLYGVMRGKPPPFFDGNDKMRIAFSNLCFHLESERFDFYQTKMKSDPLWVSVSDVMRMSDTETDDFCDNLRKNSGGSMKGSHTRRINQLRDIRGKEIPVDDGIGGDLPLEEVVGIFDRVNSRGTRLKAGSLALARTCTRWPDMRKEMKGALEKWAKVGYNFDLEWLLRAVNIVLTGEAKFDFLDSKNTRELRDGLDLAVGKIDYCLNTISGRLGLDHDRVLFAPNAIPVMVYYLAEQDKKDMPAKERDKLLFWFMQAGMRGRFSGSVESVIKRDITAVSDGIDGLLREARRDHHLRRVVADDFDASGMGVRFYPVLYFLTRTGEALDWGTGHPLKAEILGKNSGLEMHHIFPKAQLKGLDEANINALANYCFLTKGTNIGIGCDLPEEYLPEIEKKHPGALASHWIPQDRELWKMANYGDFLIARRKLLAAEMNRQLDILRGDTKYPEE